MSLGSDSVADTAVNLWADKHFFTQQGATGFYVKCGDTDPNTSPTWWGDATDHYALAWIYYTGYYDPVADGHSGYYDPNYDPNDDDPADDAGVALMMMHLDDANWTGLTFQFRFATWFHPEYPNMPPHHISLGSVAALTGAALRDVWIDPDHADWANYPSIPDNGDRAVRLHPLPTTYAGPNFGGEDLNVWERTGFWMLMQFDQDPNTDSGDPNGKYLRGAVWQGDKYDWGEKWVAEGELGGLWNIGDSGGNPDPNGDWYWPEGICAFASTSDQDRGNGFPSEFAIDHVEARTGQFNPDPERLDLTIAHPENGFVTIDPDGAMLRDPNDPFDPNGFDEDDPNTYPEERAWRFTTGTEVVLVANPWPAGKGFNKWEVTDPLDANNNFSDTNTVLYLTMDRDWEVAAKFKCGSAGMMPLLMTAALLPGLAVLRRRWPR